MGNELGSRGGPTLFAMIALSLILLLASAAIWLKRPEPRSWLSIHVAATVIFVQSAWGATWLFHGLDFWNGFLAPIPIILKTSVKLLPLLTKAL